MSEGNDAGLLMIGAAFSATAGLAAGQDADGELGDLAAPYRRRHRNPLRSVPIYATSLGGSGTITQPGTLGPPTGFYWSVRRLSAAGFTAGTVTFLLNSASGEPVASFAGAAAVPPQYYGRGEILLHPQDFLVIVAAGITGTVTCLGAADLVPDWYLSSYLG